MSTSFLGPVKNRVKDNGAREWYSALPTGKGPEGLVEFYTDFLFAKDYSASDWVVTETDAGATQAIAADITGGALLITNTAADDDIAQLQSAEEWFKLTAGKQAWFKTRLKVSDATQSDFFVGFATTDTTIIAGTTDSVGFRKTDGAATLVSLTEDNTSETTNTAATVVSDTYVDLAFHYDGAGKVDFFVNDARVASHTANIEVTNKLALTYTLQNGEAVAKTMSIDYIYVAMER